MRQELRDSLHQYIQLAASKCEGRLPDHPSHPNGRIPMAHIYDVIKGVMGKPARECRDCRYQEIIEIVDFCVDHAQEMSIIRQIKDRYQPEPVSQIANLDRFFLL